MKNILLIIFALVLNTKAFSTEWAWFYVYTENDYTQGPWSRTPVFSGQSYRYLHPTLCEELLGSGDGKLAAAILKNLRKLEPKKFNFKYDLSVAGDTVVMSFAEDSQPLKNELIASFTLNSFKALRINSGSQSRLYTLQDLTIPYMDLRAPDGFKSGGTAETKKDTVIIRETIHDSGNTEEADQTPSLWFTVSIILNCLLIFVLVRGRKK